MNRWLRLSRYPRREPIGTRAFACAKQGGGRFGPMDVLSTRGHHPRHDLQEDGQGDWTRWIRTNLTRRFNMTKQVCDAMVDRLGPDHQHLVGQRRTAVRPVNYSSAKAGHARLLQALALEVAQGRDRHTDLARLHRTKMVMGSRRTCSTPRSSADPDGGASGKPEEVAGMVAYSRATRRRSSPAAKHLDHGGSTCSDRRPTRRDGAPGILCATRAGCAKVLSAAVCFGRVAVRWRSCRRDARRLARYLRARATTRPRRRTRRRPLLAEHGGGRIPDVRHARRGAQGPAGVAVVLRAVRRTSSPACSLPAWRSTAAPAVHALLSTTHRAEPPRPTAPGFPGRAACRRAPAPCADARTGRVAPPANLARLRAWREAATTAGKDR